MNLSGLSLLGFTGKLFPQSVCKYNPSTLSIRTPIVAIAAVTVVTGEKRRARLSTVTEAVIPSIDVQIYSINFVNPGPVLQSLNTILSENTTTLLPLPVPVALLHEVHVLAKHNQE